MDPLQDERQSRAAAGDGRPNWHRKVAESPRVYDAIQALVGHHRTARRLRSILADAAGVVLDLGAGTGSLFGQLPTDVEYWALDVDPQKLGRLAQRVPRAMLLQRNALETGLADQTSDWTACIYLTHHIDDAALPLLVDEIARVTRGRLLFADAVWTGRPDLGSLLWRYDRGSHPRSAETLLAALSARFELEHVERYRSIHHYLLCVGRPRRAVAAAVQREALEPAEPQASDARASARSAS